ncbi:MAG: hypothetical protein KDK38_07195 [Leptospiraceae bacterium]|nr:hypothetical protein [Leptospiraceae bacterium]
MKETITISQLGSTVYNLLPNLPAIAQAGMFSSHARAYYLGQSSSQAMHCRARRNLTKNTTEFTFQTGKGFENWQAGDHVTLSIFWKGKKLKREYSITSGNSESISIAVKKVESGIFSTWMHEHCHPGTRLQVTQPKGDFHLAAGLPSQIALLSIGSGVTPLYAISQSLLQKNYRGEVQFLHGSPSPEETIYRDEILAIERALPGFQASFYHSREKARLTAASVLEKLTNFERTTSHVYLCGSGEFVGPVQKVLRDEGFANIFAEYYSLPASTESATGASVQLTKSGLNIQGAGNLLELSERAGLKPKHGCRRGICHECKTTKISGVVENMLTGEKSEPGSEQIRLCISKACSEVQIEL